MIDNLDQLTKCGQQEFVLQIITLGFAGLSTLLTIFLSIMRVKANAVRARTDAFMLNSNQAGLERVSREIKNEVREKRMP